ncbi:MAG TPA: histidine kinase dimerization/phospho-acceptor domain-containing protein [Bryobacteraceae bacterium]|nr:histidine kinase dimerization/phospho-acceptor domain-containing protein [Bryobacteraceae bacterium]
MRRSANKCLDSRQELRKLRTEFFTVIDHEIRAPLSGIIELMYLLEETALSAEQREYVGEIGSCAEHLLRVVTRAKEWVDLSSGLLTLEEEPFIVSECLSGAVEGMRLKAVTKGLELCFDPSGEIPGLAMGDTWRIRDLLMYIIDHCLEFTNGGTVIVQAGADEVTPARFVLTIDVKAPDDYHGSGEG